jgi:hypothetical protein
MRRLGVMILLLGLTAIAIPVIAQEEPQFDPHPHMLLQRPEVDVIDGVLHLVGFRKCVDLANNKALPLHSQHEHLHFGDSGVSFEGESGHVVLPTAPFGSPLFDPLPWSTCAEFATFLPLSIEEE